MITIMSAAYPFHLGSNAREAGFPEVRWVSDSIVEFYRRQYFEKGVDSLLVSSRAGKSIKEIPFSSKSFDERSNQRKHFVYKISVDESGSTIEARY